MKLYTLNTHTRAHMHVPTHNTYVCICVHMCSVTQSYLTLCYPVDYSLPGSSVSGILQSRILEGFPFPPPGALQWVDPGIQPLYPASPALEVDSLPQNHLVTHMYMHMHSVYIYIYIYTHTHTHTHTIACIC